MEKTTNEKSDTITIRKDSLWKYSTFALLGVIVLGVIIMALPNNGTTGNVIQQPGNNLPSQNTRVKISAGDDAFLGSENAPVEIIEFTDYECPFCGRHHVETFPSLKKDYIDTGKVKYVVKDFPLTSIHPNALPAAVAAECVREQGGDKAYFDYTDKLFSNQQILGDSNFKKWAKDIGYNIDSCLNNMKYQDEVEADLTEGANAGVRGTPGFFINGQLVSGAQPYNAFKQIIDSELA